MKTAYFTHGTHGMQLTQPVTAQRGFTLIEVMIVFFVLSVGLLGMAALQMKSMQYNQSSYIRSQATVAAYDMLDRMRVNKTEALAGAYDIAFGATPPGGTSVTATDLQQWTAFLGNTLPNGQGHVSCGASQCTVEISWTDRIPDSAGNPVTPVISFTVQL